MRGYANVIDFDNGYSLSIISHAGSMGGKHGYFEAAVLHLDGRLCYKTHIMVDDPLGWLSFNEVTPIIDAVRALKRNNLCDHKHRRVVEVGR